MQSIQLILGMLEILENNDPLCSSLEHRGAIISNGPPLCSKEEPLLIMLQCQQ